MRVAEFRQARALGIFGKPGQKLDVAKLVEGAAGRALWHDMSRMMLGIAGP